MENIKSFEEFHKVDENDVNEGMDSRYFSIVIKNFKSELDAIQQWADDGDADRATEYIDGLIKNLKDLKKKCK